VPAERFRAGDVVRVRLAPERKRDGEGNPGLALELGPQAAMVVLDPSRRDILALVGGYGFRLGAFDRSLRAEREPGSSFKPFIYAAAIDSKRYTAATLVNDSPEVFKLWRPQNHEKNKFRGPAGSASSSRKGRSRHRHDSCCRRGTSCWRRWTPNHDNCRARCLRSPNPGSTRRRSTSCSSRHAQSTVR
jgi:hypothetical protein